MSAPSVVTSRDCHSQVCSASSGTLGPVLQPLPHRCHTLWGPSCEHTQRRTDRPPFPNTPFVLHLSPTQPSLSLAPNLDPWSDAVLRPLACYQVRGSVGPDREPCPVALPWHRRGGADAGHRTHGGAERLAASSGPARPSALRPSARAAPRKKQVTHTAAASGFKITHVECAQTLLVTTAG